MKRFDVVKESKFEKLSHAEMNSVKGGLCISCMQRERDVKIGVENGKVYLRVDLS